MIDLQTKKGGFDVFVHLPENLSSTNFNAFTQTTAKHLSDATNSEKPIQKFIWRARAIFGEDINYLKAGETPFSVEGLLNDPFELEEIRGEINNLKGGLSKAKRIGIIAIGIATIFGLLGFFRQHIWDFITGCLK